MSNNLIQLSKPKLQHFRKKVQKETQDQEKMPEKYQDFKNKTPAEKQQYREAHQKEVKTNPKTKFFSNVNKANR